MLPSFFKSRKAKSFEYKPMYYNEAKEELQERYNRIAAENKSSDTYSSTNLQGRLRENWERNKKTASPQRKSNFRIILIAILLFLICFYFLF